MDERIEREIRNLKEEYGRIRESAGSLRELVHEPIDTPIRVDFWELSERELDQEMGERLSRLNDDIDCRPPSDISSHRRVIGPLIVLAKKMMKKIFSPDTDKLFVRQNRFNGDLVAFHLASFIRLRHLEKRIDELEERSRELLDDRAMIVGERGKPGRSTRRPRAPRKNGKS